MSYLLFIPIQLVTAAFKNDRVLVIGGFVLLTFGKYIIKEVKQELKKLRRQRYAKNVVILHRFRKGFNVPHDRPTLMQLETWLRFAQVPFESEFDFDVLKNGAFITYNQKDIIGARFCIDFLTKELNKDLDAHLGERDRAIATCFRTLADESLKWVIGISIFLLEPDRTRTGLSKQEFSISVKSAKRITYDQGYGRYSREEIYSIGIADLKALNDYIGDKTYLMGDRVCSADASIFAYITQIINHDKGKLHDYLMNHCTNLVRYNETIKSKYWTDWNDLIRNNGRK